MSTGSGEEPSQGEGDPAQKIDVGVGPDDDGCRAELKEIMHWLLRLERPLNVTPAQKDRRGDEKLHQNLVGRSNLHKPLHD